MATPEEQKSKLQTSRARIKEKGLGRARFEWGRKHFGIADAERPGELLHTQASRTAGARDLFDAAELETKRRAALLASQFLMRAKPPAAESPTSDQTRQAQADATAQDQAAEQGRLLLMVQQAMAKRAAAQQAQAQQEAQVSEQTRKERERIKQYAKATFRRGFIFVLNWFAAALDMSTASVSFVIDVFIYLFSLGWLNLELFYGRILMKGRSRFIGPLSWDPIPMPVDKKAIILAGFVVTADLILGVALLVFTFGSFCIVHDIVKVSSYQGAVSVGTSLAGGGTGELCFGGIIAAALSL